MPTNTSEPQTHVFNCQRTAHDEEHTPPSHCGIQHERIYAAELLGSNILSYEFQ